MSAPKNLRFIANVRLKDVVGRDLINDDNVAIIELIKNAKDAGSQQVKIHFCNVPDDDSPTSILIQDFGKGMCEDDIRYKWLNIAYSEKKGTSPSKSESYAGNKGIGRFSCDRLGETLVLYTKVRGGELLRLEIDWTKFEIDDQKKEIGKIDTKFEIVDNDRLKEETLIRTISSGTVLHIKDLRDDWSKEKLIRLKKQLEKFVIDPKRTFKVALQVDEHGDTPELNGLVENKIFEKLAFRTTSIHSEISADGKTITTTLIHDGSNLFTMREKNAYSALTQIKMSIYFLNQPAKAFFKVQTGYRSVEFGSVFLFLNGFRVLPYGRESDDWLGVDRRKQQGQRRFLGTRDVVGTIEVQDKHDKFQAVSSREGLVNNLAFKELTCNSNDVSSLLDDAKVYGYFHKIFRKLEKFVVEGLDWDSITNTSLNDEELLDASKYEFITNKQRIMGSLESIISIRSPSEYIEDVDVNFRNVIQVAKDEAESYEELVDTLQEKFEGTSVAQLTPAEKRDLSKFVERQSKEIEAKAQSAMRLEQQLNVETKRRLFAEFEQSADVDLILKMHHQTRLLSGKVFKQLTAFLQKYREKPDAYTVNSVVDVVEKALFNVDKIRKVSEFASKASFDLATNRVTEDILLFIEEYGSNQKYCNIGIDKNYHFADNSRRYERCEFDI